jgi:hypothetical protein
LLSPQPLACLGPEGLPTPRRSFVCFRLSARCERESTSSDRTAQGACGARKALAAGKPARRLRPPPRGPVERRRAAENESHRTLAGSSTLPAYLASKGSVPLRSFNLLRLALGARGKLRKRPDGRKSVRMRKPARSGKRACGRFRPHLRAILGSPWSGVRAAEGARLEIVWAGLTRLEGSNPSHSVAQRSSAARASSRSASPLAFREHSRAYSSAGERPLHTREVLGSIPSTPTAAAPGPSPGRRPQGASPGGGGAKSRSMSGRRRSSSGVSLTGRKRPRDPLRGTSR